MRLTIALVIAMLVGGVGPADTAPPESASEDLDGVPEDDLLGELVVEARRRPELVLPKIAVLDPPDGNGGLLHEVLARDLGLSGEFDVVEIDDRLAFDEPFDATRFKGSSLEAVITARARKTDDGVELSVRVFLPKVGDLAAWSRTMVARPANRRLAAHRLSDGIIGALTGNDGPFASRLVLVRTEGRRRRAYVVDADGHGLRAVSPKDHLVVTATLDRKAVPYWAASRNSGRYRLYRDGQSEPIPVSPPGSIYGIAFAPDGIDVAMAIARGAGIQVFRGALNGDSLTSRTAVELALTPTFTPDGRLVYAGVRGRRRNVYVGAKPASPRQVTASTPTVCRHPDGPRLVYAVGLGKNTDIVASRLDGKELTRLTWGSARNSAPACSPDGRLVAFFSTRKRGGGPGLYLMRLDGRRPQRVHATLGDVLVWARVPASVDPGAAP